jgi:hypothetical protein
MTTPRERFRAIRWAREWLGRVAQDPVLAAETRSTAASLLDVYPSDIQIRALIDAQAIGLPAEIASRLGAASKWIFAFQSASDATALARVLRHLPTCAEIQGKLALERPRLPSDGPLVGVHHWLEPDEDYVEVVVKGWLHECAVAVDTEYALDEAPALARPWYSLVRTPPAWAIGISNQGTE